MILPSGLRYFLLFGYVASVKIEFQEVCDTNGLRCTISDFYNEVLIIGQSKVTLQYTELVFRNCYLPVIPTVIFYNAPLLERLVMYKCSTKSIMYQNFAEASNLRALYLPNNRLTELPEKIFSNLSRVETISLGNNHISRMHSKSFKGLTQLRVLELNNNKIHELAVEVFANLTSLEYIDLSFNNIEAIDTRVFETNLRLKTIILNNNNFATFASNSLAHLPHLNVLDISYNFISDIRLQSVDTFRAQSSQMRSCVINGSVIRVRASNNQLESITINNKSSVKEIDLHNNQFDSLSDFHGMLNLQKLDISKNTIRSLNSTNTSLLLDLPSLQYLNLAYGHLEYLTVENFMLLGKLTHLDLAYNNLQLIDANYFEPLVSLEKIYFEGNRLCLFEYEVFIRNHANIKEMGIFDNDWSHSYLKKMSDVLKAKDIKLIIRFNTKDGSEMLSLQTSSHPHHIVHAKSLEHDAGSSQSSGLNNRDILIIITLCLVLLTLILQLFRILKDENVCALFANNIRRTIRPMRLDEEESEPL